MNINAFKEKVQNTEAEARLLVGAISNPTHINSLNNFLGTIVSLIDFLNDDLSLNVLENYDNKSEEQKMKSKPICLPFFPASMLILFGLIAKTR